MPELALHHVSKQFENGVDGVRDASFTAPAARLSTLVGPSGSGKSTLLRIAAGLVPAGTGEVWLGGRAATPETLRRQVTLVAQSGTLFPHLDVLGNVSFGLRSTGVGRASARSRAEAALELMGLVGFGARPWQQLSGGEQQRVQLARALVLEPSVVLLDEPLSNLDVRLRRQLRDEIRALQQRLGLTVVCVTHDETEAMGISDRIVVMNEGRVLQQGSPREVYDQPGCAFVAAFMGDAALFDVTADAAGELHLGPLAVPQLAGAHRPGARLTLMVRPQAWAIRAVGTGPGLAGTVRRCAYLGHGTECAVDTELGELLVTDRHATARHEPGAPVVLGLRAHGVTVIGAVTPADEPASPTPHGHSGSA
jgi:iron(III) transport system ATP-binding protein